jgi:phosphoadenosine phosphosulfate reductase
MAPDPKLAAANAATDLLRRAAAEHAPVALASSFGAEDMVLIDLISKAALPVGVFTLDTGRLPEETHALIDRVRKVYGIVVDVYLPATDVVESFVHAHGVNAFYESPSLRQRCCAIRKTEPLARALAGKRAWITGLRRSQSITRREVALAEFDATHGIAKFNPLADWSRDEIWSYLKTHRVPYNALFDRGYASIGCAPCTRAIEPGEDERAGRWWWEAATVKECGIHRRPGVVPIVPVEAISS